MVEDLLWLVREHLGEPARAARARLGRASAAGARGARAAARRAGARARSRRAVRAERRARRARPQPAAGARLARAGRGARGGRARGAAPAPVPAGVRDRGVLHPRRRVHPLPRARHAPGGAPELPRQRARGARLRRFAGAVAAAAGGAGRRRDRPQPLRARAPARARRAARLGARARARAAAARRSPAHRPSAEPALAGAYALVVCAPGAGEGRRRRDRRLPAAGHAAGGRRRRAASARRSSARAAAPTVRFAGRVDDARAGASCGPGAAIALAPSRSAETFGLAAAEAMAAGLPVVGQPRRRAAGARSTPRRWSRRATRRALARAIARLAGDRRGRRAGRASGCARVCAPEVVARRSRRLRAGASSGRATPKLRRVPTAPQRADHGHHRPGRLVPGGAAAREGLRGHRPGQARRAGGRSAAASTCAGASQLRARAICSSRQTLREAIAQVRPRELYHLAAPSFVPGSWQRPGARRCAAIAGSCAAILEAVRDLDRDDRACSCRPRRDLRRGAREPPARGHAVPADQPVRDRQARRAPARRRAARATTDCTRARGSLYNHESERRPEQFVTRRITRAAAAISLGLAAGADARLAGGGARLVVRRATSMAGAWLMLQQEQPEDYVLASGVAHTVAELARGGVRVRGPGRRALRARRRRARASAGADAERRRPAKARERLGWSARVELRAAGGADGAAPIVRSLQRLHAWRVAGERLHWRPR